MFFFWNLNTQTGAAVEEVAGEVEATVLGVEGGIAALQGRQMVCLIDGIVLPFTPDLETKIDPTKLGTISEFGNYVYLRGGLSALVSVIL